ncbi:hypothetical protein PMZ80_002862 [Knufia obscura]|uniref:Aminotransferase class V domain-containing protein n=1 Tax=Knufia obscura TaxID=1635080 RepID=A0ABR0RYJ7_9EURO|nr:hypothetical protein PMZ80_002862 [Knufia obscura]
MDFSHDLYNAHVAQLRSSEYPQLANTTYLDHAGTTLYATSLIDAYQHDLRTHLFSASDLSTQRIEHARLAVLDYFNADPNHFDVVFTANATAAIKLVADCFRDQDFRYGYHKDAHTSLVAVRELASLGAQCLACVEDIDDWVQAGIDNTDTTNLSLFAYPAQSNMNGYRPPLSWSSRIRSLHQGRKQDIFVLLDAASYLTTGRPDLSDHDAAPDFITLSFYKIFGYPDLGALLVRKSASTVLTHRKYFGGGTVNQLTVIGGAFRTLRSQNLHDFLEDGTLPFHNIIALTHAINVQRHLFGTAEDISKHTAHLLAWLYARLTSLKHSNHRPVFEIYGDRNATYGDVKTQGPILAFNVLRSDGTYVGKTHFERLAIDCGFQLRTGGVCNPDGIASMLDLAYWEVRDNFAHGVQCGGDIDVMGAKPTGIIRVSLGAMSIMSDLERFVDFVEYFLVENTTGTSSLATQAMQDTSPKVVAPVEGCSGMIVAHADYPRYRNWHNQWCVLNSHTGALVKSPSELSSIKATVEPKIGVLRLTHVKTDSTFSISLREHPSSMGTLSTQAIDVYTATDLTDWLTATLGFPAALARHPLVDANTSLDGTTRLVSYQLAVYNLPHARY